MRLIKDNKINLMAMQESIRKPALYEKSTGKFWDDEYISGQMLKLHLDPEVESASKTEETIAAETSFIINWTGMDEEKAVLDLGCGPGLYVKKFAETGAKVKGIDLSQRSIDYMPTDILKPGMKIFILPE